MSVLTSEAPVTATRKQGKATVPVHLASAPQSAEPLAPGTAYNALVKKELSSLKRFIGQYVELLKQELLERKKLETLPADKQRNAARKEIIEHIRDIREARNELVANEYDRWERVDSILKRGSPQPGKRQPGHCRHPAESLPLRNLNLFVSLLRPKLLALAKQKAGLSHNR